MKHIFIVFLLAAFVLNSAQNEREEALSLLPAFEEKLATTLIENDLQEFFLLFTESMDEPSVLTNITFIFENDPKYIINTLRDKGALYEMIFIDEERSAAFAIKGNPSYASDYDIREKGGLISAAIRFGDYMDKSYNIEFVAFFLDGKWKLLTINFGE